MFELLSTTSLKSGNKTTKTTKDYANVTEKVEITTERFDSPGKMTFSMLQKNIDDLSVGSVVKFKADGYNVRVLIALAAQDSKSHLEAMQAISNIFSDNERVQKILNADKAEEIYDLFISSVEE